MTAALVLALRDDGRVALDDLLYRHLPGTPIGGVTLRQLLGHNSGLQREPDGDWWERSAGTDIEKFLAALAPDKVAYPPYRAYHYSNLAYGLLGAVLTRATGVSWRDLLAERLLNPLHMRRTSYHATEPFARGYVVHPWNGTLREEPRHDAGAMAPAGQLWSTATDLVRRGASSPERGWRAGAASDDQPTRAHLQRAELRYADAQPQRRRPIGPIKPRGGQRHDQQPGTIQVELPTPAQLATLQHLDNSRVQDRAAHQRQHNRTVSDGALHDIQTRLEIRLQLRQRALVGRRLRPERSKCRREGRRRGRAL